MLTNLDMQHKILPLAELETRLQELRARGLKVVHCHGVFDLVHPGHIDHFRQARAMGDVLVVSVTADRFVDKGPGRPAFPEELRMAALAALEHVDYVTLSEEPSAVTAIHHIRPDFYVKGSDYANPAHDITGKIEAEAAAVRAHGGEIRFTSGPVFSSSNLVNRFFPRYPATTTEYLRSLGSRYRSQEIIDVLRRLRQLKVAVIGEAIIDQYSYVMPLAKSPRESIVATRFVSQEQFPGGSLAVANHLSGLVEEVTLITCLNPQDGFLEYVRQSLRPRVRLELVPTSDRPTIQKRRFLDEVFRHKMFEVQCLDDSPYPEEVERQLMERLEQVLEGSDLVLATDFGHGLLGPAVRQALCASDCFLAVNTQANSANLGFNPVTRYQRADYACLHELEVRISTQLQHEPLDSQAAMLLARLGARRLMVTRGFQGTVLYDDRGHKVETPALAVQVVDRVGAGDSVFAITAPCVRLGAPDELVGFLGNCMGALAVEIVCNREPVDPIRLEKFIAHLLK